MFKFKNWFVASFLLIFFAACTATSPTPPPLPTLSQPTAILPSTPVAAATLPPAQPTAAPTVVVPATAVATAANEGLLPRDAVWVLVDNVAVAAAPGAPQIILAQGGLHLNPFGIQAAPDGSRIAYTVNDDQGRIRFQTLDTRTGVQQVFADVPNVGIVGPRFSPDGTQLAYTMIDQSGAQGVWQLQIVGPRADDVRILQRFVQSSPNDHLMPLTPIAWTANGLLVERLLWSSDAPPHGITRVDPTSGDMVTLNDEDHIRVEIAPNGQRAAQLTGILPMGPDVDAKTDFAVIDLQSGQAQTLIKDAKIWIATLRWSPDASRLLYTRQADMSGLVTALVVMAADGSGEQVLPIGGAGVRGVLYDAVWRDNDTILLLAGDSENKLHLYQVATNNFKPDALQEVGELEGPKTQGVTPRILYIPK